MFDPKVVKMMALISQVGISMMVPIFMMMWVGMWIDKTFSTQLVLIFIILGVLAGFRNSYILLTNAAKEPKKEKKEYEETDE